MVDLGNDFTGSLDIAMTSRRLGVPGEQTPKGILTRFDGSPIGKLIAEFEASATPELVGIGMMFLQLSSDAANHINNGIDRLVKAAVVDGRQHDISVPVEIESSGFTIHVSPFQEADAKERLAAHCRIRKYVTKSDSWFGLLLTPGTGQIRGALVIDQPWKKDDAMENVMSSWPKKPMTPIHKLSRGPLRQKFGRNDPCPCGSGKKYKKRCLHRQ